MNKLKLTLTLFLAISAAFAYTQDNSLSIENDAPTNPIDTIWITPDDYSKLLIFPFEPKMYRSDIDRKIGEENGLNFQEVRGFMRLGMDNAMYLAAKDNYEVIRMHSDKADVNKDLYYAYNSTGYQYRVVPKDNVEEEKKIVKAYNKLRSKVIPEDETPDPGARIEEGELVSYPDNDDKFMAKTIINPSVIDHLKDKYDAKFFLFLNQLEFTFAKGQEYTAFGSDNYSIKASVHYTIFDDLKKEIYSGVAVKYFDSKNMGIKHIISENFPDLASQVIAKLPVLMVMEDEIDATDNSSNLDTK